MLLLSLLFAVIITPTGWAQAAEMEALAQAYPERIQEVEYRDGDWALSLDGRWYYWAEGRLLPEESRQEWEEYASIRFYNYSIGPYREPEITPELESRLMERTSNKENDTRIRYNGFLDDLYQVHYKKQADYTMKSVTLFGLHTQVHPLLEGPLERVEARVTGKAALLPNVQSYIDSLHQIHGYNWRTIAGTNRRSYHAYGVALDLVPVRYEGWAYWRWAADAGITWWWHLSRSERLSVPQAVIDAFEAEGFIWGGKWLFFDNIHFEYRPEVLLLAE